MKELYIYDFDGVLFKDPWEIHKNLLEEHKKIFATLRMFILETGYIPDHVYETVDGKEYMKLFSKTYFDQKIKKNFKNFLIQQSKASDLIIVSYNTRETIDKMLIKNNIKEIFKKVFTRSDFNTKREFLSSSFFDKYEKISFATDTISDIKEALDSGRNLSIYAVESIFHDKREFLKYLLKEDILKPFFKRNGR